MIWFLLVSRREVCLFIREYFHKSILSHFQSGSAWPQMTFDFINKCRFPCLSVTNFCWNPSKHVEVRANCFKLFTTTNNSPQKWSLWYCVFPANNLLQQKPTYQIQRKHTKILGTGNLRSNHIRSWDAWPLGDQSVPHRRHSAVWDDIIQTQQSKLYGFPISSYTTRKTVIAIWAYMQEIGSRTSFCTPKFC